MSEPVTDLLLLKQIRQVAHRQLNRSGRARGQGWILISLLERGGCATQRELCELAQRSPATLCEQLETMEAGGLIERKKSAGDKRNLDVSLSERGEALAREIVQERRDLAQRLFAPLSGSEKAQLSGLLRKLLAAPGQAEPPKEAQP